VSRAALVLALLAAQERPEVPCLDGAWWRLAAPPKLERFATGKEQTVDFTVFRAADGTWQLVSCVRNTAHPGGGRLLYRWEAAKLTDADWTPKGIFLSSDAAQGHREGFVQAPHAVVEDGVTWLVFNSSGAHALTSRDGKAFEPFRAADGGFRLFEMPRDVMLLDRRARDGSWYACFTDIRPGKYPERKDHTVSFRTAPKLAGPWSAGKTDIGVLSPPPPGYLFAFAESPFIHARKDWLYRFEQLHVYASRDPARWEGPPVAVLSGKDPLQHLSPEIVEHEGSTYLAAYRDHGKAGIFMTRLAWK
jgi:hypothetical protein